MRPAPAAPPQSTMNSVAPLAVEDRCASVPSTTLQTLVKAAGALGKRLNISLVKG